MEQLRLVGVHDDGEHLIVETPDSARYRLVVDQQLRQAVQHARRKPPARGREGASFGPRDIQARFRAGASVEDIVAESGWEPERVRRYEWPILAERSHMVAEACRVKASGTHPTHDGYRSVFEGEPKTLQETVEERAGQLGVERSSFDWDAWLREDHLWTVQLSFSVADESAALDAPGPAEWQYNPTTRSIRPENEWARALGEVPRETGPLGTSAPVTAAPSPQQPASPARANQHESTQTDELLDVLESRRGRRLGSDENSDERLAEMLGRGMGQVGQRPRPIDAPEGSPVFDRPIQPAASQAAEEKALQDDGIEIVDDSTPVQDGPSHAAPQDASEPADRQDGGDAHTDASQPWVDVTTGTGSQERGQSPSAVASLHPVAGGGRDTASGEERSGTEAGQPTGTDVRNRSDDRADEETHGPDSGGGRSQAAADGSEDSERPSSPGPRGRTPKAKRSSVPSWDDIVFGANRT